MEGRGVTQDYTKALQYYQQSAELGNIKAFNSIGILYEEGREIGQNFQKGADFNDAASMTNLGILYLEGRGVEQDLTIAKKYFQKESDLEYPKTFVKLGNLYEKGKSDNQDLSKALNCYQRAAELTQIGQPLFGWKRREAGFHKSAKMLQTGC